MVPVKSLLVLANAILLVVAILDPPISGAFDGNFLPLPRGMGKNKHVHSSTLQQLFSFQPRQKSQVLSRKQWLGTGNV